MGLFSKIGARRTERLKIRQQAKSERVSMRTETKQAAYAAGIDPNAAIANMVGNLGESAANIVGAKFQKDSSVARSEAIGQGIEKSNTNPMMIIGLVLVAVFFLFKK
jgi:hypothetical protein